MNSLINRVTTFNRVLGEKLSWLNLFMALFTFVIVFMRYMLNMSFVWMNELVMYFHATLILLLIAYAMTSGSHVRVDIFYRSFSERKKAIVNLFGQVFLLMPMAIVIIFQSWQYVVDSWSVFEASADAGGLPGVFLLKSLIPLAALLVLLQGAVEMLNHLMVIFNISQKDKSGGEL